MRLTALSLLLLFIVACSTARVETGADIREPGRNIKAGTTTKKEIIRAFGQPTKVSAKDIGEELVYESRTVETPTFMGGLIINEAGQTVTLKRLELFIQNDVVQSYRFEAR